MHARCKVDIHANIQVRELRIHEGTNAASDSPGDSAYAAYAGRKTASGDWDAIADAQFRGLAVQRTNFRVLDNFRVGVTEDGVRRQARQGNDVIGRIQVSQRVQIDIVSASRSARRGGVRVDRNRGSLPGKDAQVPQAIGARLQHLDLHHHLRLGLVDVADYLLRE